MKNIFIFVSMLFLNLAHFAKADDFSNCHRFTDNKLTKISNLELPEAAEGYCTQFITEFDGASFYRLSFVVSNGTTIQELAWFNVEKKTSESCRYSVGFRCAQYNVIEGEVKSKIYNEWVKVVDQIKFETKQEIDTRSHSGVFSLRVNNSLPVTIKIKDWIY